MKKILVATQKPFASEAIEKMRDVLSDKSGYQLELLENYTEHSQFVDAAKEVDALIIRSDKANAEVMAGAKNLKVIVRAGAGFDNIDLDAATKSGIVAMNTPGQNSNAVAELAFGLMIYMQRCQFNGKSGTELKGKSIGLHAYGNVGRAVARIAKGFEMTVYAYDPFLSPEQIKSDGVIPVESEKELYSKSNFISLHIPANEKTKNSINKNLLELMPKGAVLVNTARKEVVCEDGIKHVLSTRDDFKYVSDIAPDCADELKKEFPSRVFFTPKKMGAQSAEANINAGVAAVNQIVDFFEKGDKTFQVNK